MTTLTLIVAMDSQRGIGRDNDLPWKLPNDLKHFKELTLGKPVVMGRRTYESIGRPLPQRLNIVLTHDPDYEAIGCTVVRSLDEALRVAGDAPEVMILGGATLFKQTLPRARRIHLTEVHADVAADTWFPAFDAGQWREVSREPHAADDRHAYPYTFVTLERVLAPAHTGA